MPFGEKRDRDVNKRYLMELGRLVSTDITAYDRSTTRSMVSHYKLLRQNGVDPTDLVKQSHKAITQKLDSLVSRRRTRLSPYYKRQIGNTLNCLDRNLKYNYEFKKSDAESFDRLESVEFMDNIKKLLVEFAKVCASVTDMAVLPELLFNEYMLAITCLLTTTTSLRISEILLLQYSHIIKIIRGDPISIRTKKNSFARTIVMNDSLKYLLELISYNKTKSMVYVAGLNPMLRNFDSQRDRMRDDKIVVLSPSCLTKQIRQFSSKHGIAISRGGFNIFRAFTTSVLVDQGQHYIAKVFQNHLNVATTLNNYSIITQDNADKAYTGFVGAPRKFVPSAVAEAKAVTDALLLEDLGYDDYATGFEDFIRKQAAAQKPGYEAGAAQKPGYEAGAAQKPGYEAGQKPGYEAGQKPGYEHDVSKRELF